LVTETAPRRTLLPNASATETMPKQTILPNRT
jgi:hypothetical protein